MLALSRLSRTSHITHRISLLAICSLLFALSSPLRAQFQYDTTLYGKIQWREIGPYRAGRSVAVVGHKDQPYTFYFGATGGGIWKTVDGGSTWINVSDSSLKIGIVGALAWAESDPNVIYAGTGEACIRGNAMPGEGVYKSEDAGKSWKFIGLKDAQTISKIRVHPKDESLVYVAALGHPFGPNKDRGIYRSKDGGKQWKKILFKNDSTGAVDLAMDPNNPRILYAAMWQAYRSPWSMSSGGAGSGLWKSTDGGDTWVDLSKNKGLPQGVKGKIGIAVSPAKPDRVWASVEAEEGGLFLSDDGGKTWSKMTDDRRIRQRAWYYSHVYADPKNSDGVYILNVQFFKSADAGRTLTNISVPHGDNHDFWIDPNNPQRMIEGNDGGATVTYNGGQTWTPEDIPTAQFYHVALDNDFPYNVYGAQQDNSTVRIPSRTTGFGIGERDWFSVGGGESGYVTPDPRDPNIVYAGSYDGYLTRYDRRTDQEQDISPWPDNPMGAGAKDTKYRFQWTYPIVVSKHDHSVLYVTANVVFKTTNEGMNWEVISPDLTRNDTSKLGSSGGPITKDNTSVEYYGTIFTFSESAVDRNVLWAGSDDGLIHVSKDGGKTWTNVTPKGLPAWTMMSIIDASPHDAGTAYLAANRYKLDDFHPYIYKTIDYGKTWKKIVGGIPEYEFTHVVREDPNKKGLLYAGTERGIYVSFDAGEHWQSLRLNLPIAPVHDLAIQAREKDLVAATHGRSFWILDDLTPLYQMSDSVARATAFLFRPRESYRIGGFSFDRPGLALGKNPPNGAVVYYCFKNKPGEKDSVKLEFLDETGKLIKSFAHREEKKDAKDDSAPAQQDEGPNVPADSGMNRFVWDMRYPDATKVPGAILWGGSLQGPTAIPGSYQVRLVYGKKSRTQSFEVKKDPRLKTTLEDLKEQFDFSMKIRDKISAAHDAINAIRDIRSQTGDLVKRLEKNPLQDSVKNTAKKLNDGLKAVEEELIQVKIKSSQDALNYPIKLNDKLAGVLGVVSSADTRPTQQSYDVYNELASRVDAQLEKYKKILETDLAAFNETVKKLDIPAVIVKPAEKK
ncbi:MAG: glycosyl hydrolase [Ignavibacteriae bacterium]|nr:glycosyl hydrolase [Ignavibacteria bacterium]MBI3363860.1 glycosyl hydrolase [Ignavibacteriota bacterium]